MPLRHYHYYYALLLFSPLPYCCLHLLILFSLMLIVATPLPYARVDIITTPLVTFIIVSPCRFERHYCRFSLARAIDTHYHAIITTIIIFHYISLLSLLLFHTHDFRAITLKLPPLCQAFSSLLRHTHLFTITLACHYVTLIHILLSLRLRQYYYYCWLLMPLRHCFRAITPLLLVIVTSSLLEDSRHCHYRLYFDYTLLPLRRHYW